MIRSKTVFIIGAGAGFDLGMPLGDQLSRIIGEKLNIKFKSGGYEQASGDFEIMDALRRVSGLEKVNVNEYITSGWGVAEGVGFSRSIDSYLNAHTGNEKVKTCAKLGIVKTILEAERHCAVYIDHRNSRLEFKDRAAVMISWLQSFMFLLQDRVQKQNDLSKIFENVKIINFNYDRCVEQFLWLALQKVFAIGAEQAADLVNTLPIIHPYGVVGCLNWQPGLRIGFGEEIHPHRLIDVALKIRTFNEQIEDEDALSNMAEWISDASRLVFLGFHFHDQNMELLRSKLPARGGLVNIYCTGVDRSDSDLHIIHSQISEMLSSRGGTHKICIERRWDCSGLFKEFGTAMAR